MTNIFEKQSLKVIIFKALSCLRLIHYFVCEWLHKYNKNNDVKEKNYCATDTYIVTLVSLSWVSYSKAFWWITLLIVRVLQTRMKYGSSIFCSNYSFQHKFYLIIWFHYSSLYWKIISNTRISNKRTSNKIVEHNH